MQNPSIDFRHKLDRGHFEQVFKLLAEEQEANSLTGMQRFFYRLLMFAVYGAIGLFALIMGGTFIGGVIGLRDERWLGPLIVVLFVLFVVVILAVPFLVLLNISLLRKVWRQAQLVRRLGLRSAYELSWKEQKKQKRWSRIFRSLLFPLGLMFVVGAFLISEENKISELFIPLLIGLSLVGAYFIMLSKKMMDNMMDVDALRRSLEKYRIEAELSNDDFISVPIAKMVDIANIEAGQIVRQRVEAISEMNKADERGYTARRSKGFQVAAVDIGAEERLAVEERITGLLNLPRPDDAVTMEDGQTMVLEVPGTPYSLAYSIDDARQQIDFLALNEAAGEARDRIQSERIKR